jgi:hypothetical protein
MPSDLPSEDEGAHRFRLPMLQDHSMDDDDICIPNSTSRNEGELCLVFFSSSFTIVC